MSPGKIDAGNKAQALDRILQEFGLFERHQDEGADLTVFSDFLLNSPFIFSNLPEKLSSRRNSEIRKDCYTAQLSVDVDEE
ncbi:hypothetical protein RUM44_000039 [Polyplax serrata]|uniref:Uncharacterized protein n=1 Tax=Polyplax serrata TaxID=468196 RepID=A0ABR1B4B0_POLSC